MEGKRGKSELAQHWGSLYLVCWSVKGSVWKFESVDVIYILYNSVYD